MDPILGGLNIVDNVKLEINCPKNKKEKILDEKLENIYLAENSEEELTKLLSNIYELECKKEELEEICPNFLLAIQKYSQFPKWASLEASQTILDQCFEICQKLALAEDSKLIRKTASAGLKILLAATKIDENLTAIIWDTFLTLLDGLEEPQYHLILPMLPKFEILIKFTCKLEYSNLALPANQFSWDWLRLLFEKTINHPNGWIRIWALQRVAKLPKKLHQDKKFILISILPALNGIDPLWRFAEKGELDNFIGQIGQMLSNSLELCCSNENKIDFIISLIELLSNPTKLWTACPLYFLSKSFNFGIEERNIFPIENAEFHPHWRCLFRRIAEIPHISLRIATNLNFLNFFIRLHHWTINSHQKFAYFMAKNLLERGLSKEEFGGMIEEGINEFCRQNLIVDKFTEMLKKVDEIYMVKNKSIEENTQMNSPSFEYNSARDAIENLCEFILETKNFQLICENYEKMEKMMDELKIEKLDSNELSAFFGNLINRLFCQCNEQRKSRNFLPNLKYFLRICFHQKIIKFTRNEEKELLEIIKEKLDQILGQSQMNIPIGVLLAQQMFNSRNLLGINWTKHLIELAIFGPHIKREWRILCFAYQQIYDEAENQGKYYLPMENANLFNLCAHQCRILAIKTICSILAKSNGQFLNSILLGIIKNFNELNKTKSSSFGLSMAHRQKTRLTQLLILMLDFANTKEMIDPIFDHCVLNLLDQNQQYSIKLFFEWILSRILAKFPQYFPKFLELQNKFANERIGSICSWLNIFHHHLAINNSIDQIQNFFSLILPWSTHQNFSIRCTALAAIRLAWKQNLHKLKNLAQFSLTSNLAEFDFGMFTGNSSRIINFLCDDFYFAHFHPIEHFSLQTILQIFPSKTGMPPDEIFPTKLFTNFEENNELKLSILCSDQKFIEAASLVYSNLVKKNEEICLSEKENNKNELIGEVQRKLNIFEGKNEEGIELIVCATLINKAANLGGLCRTCEIFNVRTLCISNKMLMEKQEFKALSLNAENWLHIEEVKSKDLFTYLGQKRKKESFECIAAEQTTRSVPLEKFKFPRRSILLLGDEKEGIPAELFGQVDSTVEITQLGKTRSLNVHVSAALCIHQFAAQWLMKRE